MGGKCLNGFCRSSSVSLQIFFFFLKETLLETIQVRRTIFKQKHIILTYFFISRPSLSGRSFDDDDDDEMVSLFFFSPSLHFIIKSIVMKYVLLPKTFKNFQLTLYILHRQKPQRRKQRVKELLLFSLLGSEEPVSIYKWSE